MQLLKINGINAKKKEKQKFLKSSDNNTLKKLKIHDINDLHIIIKYKTINFYS